MPISAREAKLLDIKNNPKNHQHTFEGLQRCCFINGFTDLGVMDAHEVYASQGSNGGRSCDVRSGPCSCGAWH